MGSVDWGYVGPSYIPEVLCLVVTTGTDYSRPLLDYFVDLC